MVSLSSEEERALLSEVVRRLPDEHPKVAYADWLEARGDPRGTFLRRYVQASRSLTPADFPSPDGLQEEWLELTGFRLMERLASDRFPELKEPVLRLARPALRMKTAPSDDPELPVAASKIGGHPDLPWDFKWPEGRTCRAIYNDDTRGITRLAGFIAQVNFAEIAGTQAAKDLPESGVLSFFCFQDIEHDNPDIIGARAIYFPDPAILVRTPPPRKLREGNEITAPQRLTFEETLDLPEPFDGPWSDDLNPNPDRDYDPFFEWIRHLNFENLLGYARSTTGGDPTPSKDSRHLILLDNSVGCRLHIQILQKDLAARRFERITLDWVDFD